METEVPLDCFEDALGNRVVPGSSVAYVAGDYLRFSRVIRIWEEPNRFLSGRRATLLRILGYQESYASKGSGCPCGTYEATIARLDRVVVVHPDHYSEALRWLEAQAKEKGLP